MVLIAEWDLFIAQAQAMIAATPGKTRLLTKYNHSKGRFTLKVTDNVKTITHSSEQANDIRFADKLTAFLEAEATKPLTQGELAAAASATKSSSSTAASKSVVKPVAYAKISGAQRRKRQREREASAGTPAPRMTAASIASGEVDVAKLSGRKRREAEHLQSRAAKRVRREEKRLKASLEATAGSAAGSASAGGPKL